MWAPQSHLLHWTQGVCKFPLLIREQIFIIKLYSLPVHFLLPLRGKWLSECFPLMCNMSIYIVSWWEASMLACWPIIPLPPPINIYWAGLGRGSSTPSSYPTVATQRRKGNRKNGKEKLRRSPPPLPIKIYWPHLEHGSSTLITFCWCAKNVWHF